MDDSIGRIAAGVAIIIAINAAGGAGAAVASATPGSSPGHSHDDAGSGGGRNDHGGERGPRADPGSGQDRSGRDQRGEGPKAGHSRGSDRPGNGNGSSRGDGQDPQPSKGKNPAAAIADVPDSGPTASPQLAADSVAPVPAAQGSIAGPPVAASPGGDVTVGDSPARSASPSETIGAAASARARLAADGLMATHGGPITGQSPSVVPVPQLAAPAVPETAPETVPVSSPPPVTTDLRAWPSSQLPVASLWGRVQPGWPVGALFGIAGLLLAPLAGVWLGHRQARAARSASELVSR